MMVRQCAWCLRLINSAGERLSPSPLPKLYEASHGICGDCGTLWMEQVIETENRQGETQEKQESITKLVLQLQQGSPKPAAPPRLGRSPKLRIG